MYYVYFLKSLKKANWVYVGSTNNIERRVKEYVNGLCKYTRVYHPVFLESYIAVKTDNKCRALEKYFKTGSGIVLQYSLFLDEGIQTWQV